MKAIHVLERLAVIIFTIGLVFYALVYAKLWASDLQVWFVRAGDWQTFILISIGVFVFAKLLERFLKWEINFLLPHRKRRQ